MEPLTSAVLLISGGMDSVALAYWKRPAAALIVNYGQKPFQRELDVSRYVCQDLKIPLYQQTVLPLPAARPVDSPEGHSSDWVPFRNQLLITLGASLSIQFGLEAVMIGTVQTDRKFADGSPSFLAAMMALLQTQEGQLRLLAPASSLSTLELFEISGTPREVFNGVYSCTYAEQPCQRCSSCVKYAEVMASLSERPKIGPIDDCK
ncbi:7-cyano-7-deazaguanine synthase [Deinococcus sp.]|uniref:7-cyano-7-deazaguanine synthase n=1 Tax=Deinococcus sp. TaxID=47478 RepID=UPI00391950F9